MLFALLTFRYGAAHAIGFSPRYQTRTTYHAQLPLPFAAATLGEGERHHTVVYAMLRRGRHT